MTVLFGGGVTVAGTVPVGKEVGSPGVAVPGGRMTVAGGAVSVARGPWPPPGREGGRVKVEGIVGVGMLVALTKTCGPQGWELPKPTYGWRGTG